MAKFAERLKALRTSKGLSQADFSRQVNTSKSSINMYERGEREPSFEMLERIADYFNVDMDFLLGKSDIANRNQLSNLSAPMLPYNPTRKIPILGRISAGLPLYAEEHIEGYTYTELNGGAEYFALRVTGDSMTAARIYDGDTLIVRRQDIVENGQIAVVIVGDDEATVKRFYRDGKQITLMPQSTNHIHQPQVYDSSQTRIRVIGLVVKNEITF